MTDSRVARRVVLVRAGEAGVPELPEWLASWVAAFDVVVIDAHALGGVLHRGRPDLVLSDAAGDDLAIASCVEAKRDAYTALVPWVAYGARGVQATARLLNAGADDVVDVATQAEEAVARLERAIARSRRDRDAQPTTGLPGPPAIDAAVRERLASGEAFAAAYADLDHFKEFNDRYGFAEGNRVIRLVGRLLHDVVRGIAPDRGFVGHIGGDDFLFVAPLGVAERACQLVIETFDLLAPLQYSAADRRAGYYLGKDRRGQLHRVPLMTISVGVVTTERRRFASSADVSRLASEMKAFAKTRAGSVYAFDRRSHESPLPAATLFDAP